MVDGQTISGTVDVQSLDSVLPKERVADLKGTGKGPHLFVTARVDDPELVRELEAAGIRFTGKNANPWLSMLLGWVLPVLFFFLPWRFMSGP